MKRYILPVCVLLVASASCLAEPILNENYFDLGYRHTFFDEKALDDGNGLEADLSVSPIDNFLLEGGYSYADSGVDSVDIDANIWTYGIGAYKNFCDEWHLIGRVGGIHEDVDSDVGDFDDDGYYLGAEIRYALEQNAELDLEVTYTNVDSDGEWIYGGSVIIPVCENAGLRFNAQINDDTDVGLLAGVRFTL